SPSPETPPPCSSSTTAPSTPPAPGAESTAAPPLSAHTNQASSQHFLNWRKTPTRQDQEVAMTEPSSHSTQPEPAQPADASTRPEQGTDRLGYGPSLDEMWAPAYRTAPDSAPAPQGKTSGVSTPIVAAIVAAALIGGLSGAGVGIWAVSS